MGLTIHMRILDTSDIEKLRNNTSDDELWPDIDEDLEEDFYKNELDLDKSWHELHYLICGNLESDGSDEGDAIFGGEEIGPNLGYGKAHLIEASKVKKISAALDKVDLHANFDRIDKSPETLGKIRYSGPDFIDDRVQAHLERLFNKLKSYYAKAALESKAMLIYPA